MKYQCSCGDIIDLDKVFKENSPIDAAMVAMDWALEHMEKGHTPEKLVTE